MTNLSPYRLGNVFEYDDRNCVFIGYTEEHYAAIYCLESRQYDESIQFLKTAVLKEITLEFLSELAREKGEEVTWEGGYYIVIFEDRDDDNGEYFEPEEDETLGAFCLRVARARNYLS